ncbi:bacteriocin secretion accessory protein [Lactococcus hircilactis]|uniref:Bacteriocin secretion accessory protein n=1 Tax=Lactococcus hircilactis TaxID=1494462 RepID=A0A7X1ZC41_9LACT|nr:bacteriocin secretion accessory protein [Lactococcus hircilactis]MQW40696.1 bacteriocin secretion accessory protein [Lactococcus hircilactis]
MFDKRLLESSELYDKRYRNFATLIIFPILTLFIGLFIFAFFAKKELVVTTSGDIEPTKIVAQIQSTSNNKIIQNDLSEGKSLTKDTILLRYNGDSDATQLSVLNAQLTQVQNQKQQLGFLQNSLLQDKNLFKKGDDFGYEQTFENYQAQVKTLSDNIAKSNQGVADQNATVSNEKEAINQQIDTLNTQISQYTELENTASGNGSISSNNPYLDQYNSYTAQLEALQNTVSMATSDTKKTAQVSADAQKSTLKAQFLATVQGDVASLQSQIQSLTVQSSGLTNSNTYDNSLSSQSLSLTAGALASANKKMSGLDESLTELHAKIALQNQVDEQSTVRAGSVGILHVLPNILGLKAIPAGTPIAEVYPELSKNVSIDLTAYVPSTEISALKNGQTLRFTVEQNLPKPEILSGKISKIDSAPTAQNGLNLYKVQAQTLLKSSDVVKLRYGLQGKVTIITGNKSYFDYYKDKVLGKD